MIKKMLIGLAAVLALLIAGGLVLPDDFHVERSVAVDAPLHRIQPLLEDLARWPEWSPWEQADTTIVTTLGEITRGVGASQSWTDGTGGGRLVLTRCEPGLVEYDVFFADSPKPARSIMRAVPGPGASTVVSWSMAGEMDMPVVGPYFKMLAGAMIGPMFQQGLDNLKRATEAEAMAPDTLDVATGEAEGGQP